MHWKNLAKHRPPRLRLQYNPLFETVTARAPCPMRRLTTAASEGRTSARYASMMAPRWSNSKRRRPTERVFQCLRRSSANGSTANLRADAITVRLSKEQRTTSTRCEHFGPWPDFHVAACPLLRRVSGCKRTRHLDPHASTRNDQLATTKPDYAASRAIAFLSQSRPRPGPRGVTWPRTTWKGSASTAPARSSHSTRCAVGVTAITWALASGKM
jgi:hypothetical protein